MILNIKINHDVIEFEGEPIADFRQSFPSYKRDEIRGLIESALETDYLFNEGDLIPKDKYEELETQIRIYKSTIEDSKHDFNNLLNHFETILETLGPKTKAKFETLLADLTTLEEGLKI